MAGGTALREMTIRRIAADPRFHELRRRRRRLGGALTVVMCLIYFGYLLVASLAPEFMAQCVGATMTLGMVTGVAVILSAVALTALYVWYANQAFDRLVDEICGCDR